MADISKLNGYNLKDATARANISIVPDYVKTEAEATITKAQSHTNLGQTIRFIALSDSHNDSKGLYTVDGTRTDQISVSNLHCGQAIKYIADRIGLDFIVNLGDNTLAGESGFTYDTETLLSDIQQMNGFLADGVKNVPHIYCVGNHDQTAVALNKRLYNSGAYMYFGKNCTNESAVGANGYGYFDIKYAKVRVIYLNTSDVADTYGTANSPLAMQTTQKNWLAETLIALNTKSDASSWKILILSHAPGDDSSVFSDVITAYANGGTWSSYTFTTHDALILANCHGHKHAYYYGYINDKIRRFCIPNACFYENNHYDIDPDDYDKTANSGEDTAFSLVTIDVDNNYAYVDNYGAGIDRSFSCDYYVPAITNLLETIGYETGKRISSTGGIKAQDGYYSINYVPVTVNDVIRIKGHAIPDSSGNSRICGYDSSKTFIATASLTTQDPYSAGGFSSTYDSDTGIETITFTNSSFAYVRFCFVPTDSIGDCIVTKNEAIT